MTRCPSGVENTCPFIDEVISYLEDIEIDDHDDARMRDYNKENMERIRLMNSTLRSWGTLQYEEKLEVMNDVEEKEKRIQELEAELADLRGEISELESEVSRQSDRIVELEDTIVVLQDQE